MGKIKKYIQEHLMSIEDIKLLYERLDVIKGARGRAKNQLNKEYKEIREKLIVKNLCLVDLIIATYFEKFSCEDLRMCGIEGLIVAINTYNKDKDNFYDFVIKCIIEYIEENVEQYNFNISDTNSLTQLEVDTPYIQYDYDFLDNLERQELHKLLMEALATLSVREAKIISERFGLDGEKKTLKDLGEHFGVSGERIRRIELKTLTRLRRTPATDKLKIYLGYDIKDKKRCRCNDDIVYRKLIGLFELNATKEVILEYMNKEGLNWTMKDVEINLLNLERIIRFIKYESNELSYEQIATHLKTNFHVTFSFSYLNYLVSTYSENRFQNAQKAIK